MSDSKIKHNSEYAQMKNSNLFENRKYCFENRYESLVNPIFLQLENIKNF